MLHGLLASFVLLAVPLFIFAAQVMNAGSISDRLLQFALALVERFRGGLAQVNVLTSLIFASMSGSATADAAGIGRVEISMMTAKRRYPPGFAAAVTAASATIGPIFPPSIIMVFYAIVSSTSIGALFLAGVVPGIDALLGDAVEQGGQIDGFRKVGDAWQARQAGNGLASRIDRMDCARKAEALEKTDRDAAEISGGVRRADHRHGPRRQERRDVDELCGSWRHGDGYIAGVSAAPGQTPRPAARQGSAQARIAGGPPR